jgi:16S rRNA (cytosine1402-N4)-methyltransferase
MSYAATTIHESVLTAEVVAFLAPRKKDQKALFLDCTLGGAGHTAALLESYSELKAVALDLDTAAIDRAHSRLQAFNGRYYLVHGSFAELPALLSEHRSQIVCELELASDCEIRFDAILADLGYSSDQLEDASRGLSFLREGPLDMRLNPQASLTAEQVVNEYEPAALRDVFRRGGLGPGSTILARAIVRKRPFNSTLQLAALCEEIFPRYRERKKRGRQSEINTKHPATVPFQALRIEVNNEWHALEELLASAESLLAAGGRLAVISFQSLEDKLVTSEMRRWERREGLRDLPIAGPAGRGKLLTKKAITPTLHELSVNPRSRSARLRVFEKN